jgi:uncharacterized protein (TIGR02145 family)
MAENLRFMIAGTNTNPADTVGVCYNYDPANCNTYGRLYTWAEAKGQPGFFNSNLLTLPENAQGICPTDWHLPTQAEWDTLIISHNGSSLFSSGTSWTPYSGTDSTGFGILPAGYGNGTVFGNLGSGAYFWTGTEVDASFADERFERLDVNKLSVFSGTDGKVAQKSVRCIHD